MGQSKQDDFLLRGVICDALDCADLKDSVENDSVLSAGSVLEGYSLIPGIASLEHSSIAAFCNNVSWWIPAVCL